MRGLLIKVLIKQNYSVTLSFSLWFTWKLQKQKKKSLKKKKKKKKKVEEKNQNRMETVIYFAYLKSKYRKTLENYKDIKKKKLGEALSNSE